MKLYVYCVCDVDVENALANVSGLEGRTLKAFDSAGLSAIVSEFSEAKVSLTPENVKTHARVNAIVLGLSTPLPLRFGTLVTDDLLATYLNENAAALRDALMRVRGCVEMGVKILRRAETKEKPSEVSIIEAEPTAGLAKETTIGQGTAFLMAKQQELLGDEVEREQSKTLSAWLVERLGEEIRDSRITLRPSPGLAVRAAFLVQRDRLTNYNEVLRALVEERAAEFGFLLSGPWPPYSFSDLRP